MHEYRMGHLACSTPKHDRCNEVVPELNKVHPLETHSFLYQCIVCVYIHSYHVFILIYQESMVEVYTQLELFSPEADE